MVLLDVTRMIMSKHDNDEAVPAGRISVMRGRTCVFLGRRRQLKYSVCVVTSVFLDGEAG